jgi:hypothetical protein
MEVIMKYILHICCVTLLLFATSVQANEFVDGPRPKEELRMKVRKMFEDNKYAELDAMADKFRSNKSRYPDGGWKLLAFFNAFDLAETHPQWVFGSFIRLAEEWRRSYPKSVTAQIVLAQLWESYAYHARGRGYASEVKKDAWPVFKERLEKAWKIINERPASGVADSPERHNLRLKIALAQGVDRKKFDAIFQEAVHLEPTYYAFYINKAEYLDTRWHGKEGEWQRFMAESADKNPGGEGATIYARTAVSKFGLWNSFKGEGVSWEKMKTGFEQINRNYPNSPYIINTYASFACLAEDRKTLNTLFKRINSDTYYPEAWGKIRIGDCRSLAGLPNSTRQ